MELLTDGIEFVSIIPHWGNCSVPPAAANIKEKNTIKYLRKITIYTSTVDHTAHRVCIVYQTFLNLFMHFMKQPKSEGLFASVILRHPKHADNKVVTPLAASGSCSVVCSCQLSCRGTKLRFYLRRPEVTFGHRWAPPAQVVAPATRAKGYRPPRDPDSEDLRENGPGFLVSRILLCHPGCKRERTKKKSKKAEEMRPEKRKETLLQHLLNRRVEAWCHH